MQEKLTILHRFFVSFWALEFFILTIVYMLYFRNHCNLFSRSTCWSGTLADLKRLNKSSGLKGEWLCRKANTRSDCYHTQRGIYVQLVQYVQWVLEHSRTFRQYISYIIFSYSAVTFTPLARMVQFISQARGYLCGFIYEVTRQIHNTSHCGIKQCMRCAVSYSWPRKRDSEPIEGSDACVCVCLCVQFFFLLECLHSACSVCWLTSLCMCMTGHLCVYIMSVVCAEQHVFFSLGNIQPKYREQGLTCQCPVHSNLHNNRHGKHLGQP